jgi:hypothetical protein
MRLCIYLLLLSHNNLCSAYSRQGPNIFSQNHTTNILIEEKLREIHNSTRTGKTKGLKLKSDKNKN